MNLARRRFLRSVRRALDRRAYAPAVQSWSGLLRAHAPHLAAARTEAEFVDRLNAALSSAGVSHLSLLSPDEARSRAAGRRSDDGTLFGPPSVSWIDATAIVRVPSFGASYERAASEAAFAQARRADGIILDMRGNNGGNADHVRHLLGRLLPASSAVLADVYRRDARRFGRRVRAGPATSVEIARWLNRDYTPIAAEDGTDPYDGPVVTLVDGRCASGGELAPAVLREHGRSLVAGAATRGKVRIGEMVPLRGGYVLQVPIGEFVTSGGASLEGNPLQPDVVWSAADTDDDRTALARASELLRDATLLGPTRSVCRQPRRAERGGQANGVVRW